MKPGMLVQRDKVGGMLPAEDASATTAVMSTIDPVEVLVARIVVARW